MKLFQMLQFNMDSVKRMKQGEVFTFKCNCGNEIPIGWEPKNHSIPVTQPTPHVRQDEDHPQANALRTKLRGKAKGYPCPWCHKMLKSRRGMGIHVRLDHPKMVRPRPVKQSGNGLRAVCPVPDCGKEYTGFNAHRSLHGHMGGAHPNWKTAHPNWQAEQAANGGKVA